MTIEASFTVAVAGRLGGAAMYPGRDGERAGVGHQNKSKYAEQNVGEPLPSCLGDGSVMQ